MEREFRIQIYYLDGISEELGKQLPIDCTFVRELRGADAGQYLLFTVDRPLTWKGRSQSHVIVGGRLVGQPVSPAATDFTINLAIVTDPALATASIFRFDQADFAEIGRAKKTAP